jgi:hypothetical protein
MAKRIKNLLIKMLPYDKLLHFVGGTYIFLIANIFLTSLFSLMIVVLISIIIELYDKLSGKGTPELTDIFYCIVGALTPFLINII